MLRIAVLILISIVGFGCATASKINRVSVGMTKPEVLDTLGDPDSSKAKDDMEVLVYNKYATGTDSFYGRNTEYWIVLVNGKVKQYGRAGDFGTFQPETKRIILDQNISNK